MPAARAWWRPALFALAAPPFALALGAMTESSPALALLALSLVGTLPLSIALLASMMRRRDRYSIAAAAALGLALAVALLMSGTGIGILGIFAIIPFAAALALLWADDRAGPATIAAGAFVVMAGLLAAPVFGARSPSIDVLSSLGAGAAAAFGAATIWGATMMSAREELPREAEPTPQQRWVHADARAPVDTRVARWLVGAGVLLALSIGPLPWTAAPIVLTLGVALLVVPALVALREKPPAAIALGALALGGLVPIEGCAAFDAMTGACHELPDILGYLWVIALAGVAWIGLALRPRPAR